MMPIPFFGASPLQVLPGRITEVSGKTCKKARIVLGAAAPVPYRSIPAEEAIANQVIGERTADAAAEAALDPARPLSRNGYKVPLFRATIKQAILEIGDA